MGQTLTNGVYLPDEGERNCYNGLAANWQILDNSVGTIASHTTQIAGKANAVHTHTKSDITDFPAYGNAAGTICEGNDSRLSDARTPVSHTHGKADITDLFNSANTWTGVNTFTSSITTMTNVDRTVAPTSDSTYGTIICRDKNGSAMFRMQGTIKTDLSNMWGMTLVAPNASYITFFRYTISSSTDRELRFKANSVVPDDNATADLGTTNNKWKTLNGINPGALSLPSFSYTAPNAIEEIDRTGWVYDGSVNSYNPPVDCWLSISNGGAITVWGTNTAFGMKATDNIAIPLRYGETYNISMTHTPDFCRIYPCLGNV